MGNLCAYKRNITPLSCVLVMNPPVTILWLPNPTIRQCIPCMVRIRSKIFTGIFLVANNARQLKCTNLPIGRVSEGQLKERAVLELVVNDFFQLVHRLVEAEVTY